MGQRSCRTCGWQEARPGGTECPTCAMYRSRHGGQARPEELIVAHGRRVARRLDERRFLVPS